ncbi:MAG: DUF6600 domain-containing protein [Terriglobales bacterium]
MSRNAKCAFVAAVAAFLLLMTLPVVADSQVRIVRLSAVEGDVQIDRHTGQGFEPAITNMPVVQATLLRTGADGRAEVEFEDDTVIRLAPASQVDFRVLSLRDSGAKVSTIAVDQGTVYFTVQHEKGDEFTAEFAGREVPVNKSAHFRVDVNPDNATLAVFKGKLWVGDEENRIEVSKGESLTLALDGNADYLAKNIEPNEYDEWDKERGEYHERYYADSSYNSYPYYGRGDLSYYGGWYSIPGHGVLWQPYGIGLGWDPYYSGYWAWYPAWGYTWVSSYPWGWLPYRYGSWVWVPNWGWGWTPGRYWRTWNPHPRVVDPPRGFVTPMPPTAPNRPTTLVGTRIPTPSVPPTHRRRGFNTGPDAGTVRPPRVTFGPSVDIPRDRPTRSIGTTVTPGSSVTTTAPDTFTPAPRRGHFGTEPSTPPAAPPSAPRTTAPTADTPRIPRSTPPPAPTTVTPSRPAPAPRVDTPRSTPRVDTPRSAPRMDTPRSTPRVDAPRPAPRVDVPRSAPSAPPPSASSMHMGGMGRSMGAASAVRAEQGGGSRGGAGRRPH